MKSEDLADEVEELITRCRARVLGTGNEQYSYGDTQKFETLPLLELIDWAMEEVEDSAAYAVMQHIRLRRLRAAIEAAILATGDNPAASRELRGHEDLG